MAENSVVAFIDILGYKETLKNCDNEKKLFTELKDAYDEAFKYLDRFLNEVNSVKKEKKYKDRIVRRQFSDHIYLSLDYTDDKELGSSFFMILLLSAFYQRIMLGNGFYVRGGTTKFNKKACKINFCRLYL